jgi:thioredoxin reductase (NADPH)
MTTTVVENWPGAPDGVDGYQLISDMRKQAVKFGTEILSKDITKVDFSVSPKKVWAGDEEYEADAIIISTGARSRTLGLPREKELWARGIHTCATCDGAFYKDKVVAVVGGGDAAAEESTFLTKFASKVLVYVRGDELRASAAMASRMKGNEKIEIHYNTEVKEYLGDDKLSGLNIVNTKTNEEGEVAVSALFFSIGHIPNTEIFKGQVAIHESGYIIPTDNVHTSVDGVFVAGDCGDWTYRQAITASGLGAMAAIVATRWIEAKGLKG